MRRLHGSAALLSLVVLVGACLGDDPNATVSGSEADGGDGSALGAPDERTLSDAGPGDSEAGLPKAGTLDTTFPTAALSLGMYEANAAAFDDSGRLYVVGRHDCLVEAGAVPCVAIMRVTEGGVIDSTFGGGGRVTHRLSGPEVEPYYADEAWSVVIDRDRIHVGGQTAKSPIAQSFGAPMLLTLAADGSIVRQRTFPSAPAGAVWSLALGGSHVEYRDVYAASSKSTKADSFVQGNATRLFLGQDGLDPHALEITQTVKSLSAVTFASAGANGELLVTGTSLGLSDRTISVMKLAGGSSGDVVAGWAGSGTASFNPTPSTISEGHGIALDSTGRILVAGVSGVDAGGSGFQRHLGPLTVVRFSAGGQIDTTFGNMTALGGGAFQSSSLRRMMASYEDPEILLDDSGRIVVGGLADSEVEGASTAAITRVLPTGKLDADFGADGVATCGPTKDSVPVALLRVPRSNKLLLVARRKTEIFLCRFHG